MKIPGKKSNIFLMIFVRFPNSQCLQSSRSRTHNDFFKMSLKICSSSPPLKLSMDHPFQVNVFKKDQLKLEQAEGKMFPL